MHAYPLTLIAVNLLFIFPLLTAVSSVRSRHLMTIPATEVLFESRAPETAQGYRNRTGVKNVGRLYHLSFHSLSE